jgi:hypothetical protein
LESRKPEYVAAKEDYDSFLNNMSDEVGGTAIVAPLKYET